MTKWIKPTELPTRFHGHCWVCWQSGNTIHDPFLATVQNYYRGRIPEYFSDYGVWNYLNEDYLVSIIEKPEAPEGWDK